MSPSRRSPPRRRSSGSTPRPPAPRAADPRPPRSGPDPRPPRNGAQGLERPAPQTDGPAAPAPEEDAASLRRKYRELQDKYARLVEHQRDRLGESMSLMALSSWALETQASGLLLVEEGQVRVTNPRWNALTHLGDERASWRALGAGDVPDGPPFPSLREAALYEAKAVLEAPPRSVRTRRYCPEGCAPAVELRVEHLVHRNGRHLAVMLAHDVTAQRAAERELRTMRDTSATRERMRALGEVMAGVTHDLNNTLQAMRLRVQLLQADPAVAAAQGPALETLRQIVADAASRVDRLHDFARRRPPSAPGPVDLQQVVREAVELVRTEFSTVPLHAGGSPVEVEVALPPGLPAVRGWTGELRYVLLNLLLNARDAMPHGGWVWVSAEPRPDHLLLAVEDNGTGILPEHLHRIFEPLFTTKRERNSGLGLSMAYSVMERLGGSIRALNRPEGGARFELLFPLAQ